MEDTKEERPSYSEEIKQKQRDLLQQDRQEDRDNIINKRRGILGEIAKNSEGHIKPDQVVKVAHKIKQKGSVTEKDLRFLSRAFIRSGENTTAFINIEGALHALVRELTGNNAIAKLAAAECCVNLSLGNPKCCLRVAKSSGPYLIMYLQGMNVHLTNTSIWALGNLVGSDLKTFNLLNTQGLLQLLLDRLEAPETQENVIYTLIQYVKTGHSTIPSDDLVTISTRVMCLPKRDSSPDVMRLLYLLSCSEVCDDVLFELIKPCLELLSKPDAVSEPVKLLTASVRIIGNLVSEKETGKAALAVLSRFDTLLLIFEQLMQPDSYPHICMELAWAVGNLVNHPNEAVQKEVQVVGERLSLLELFCTPINFDKRYK